MSAIAGASFHRIDAPARRGEFTRREAVPPGSRRGCTGSFLECMDDDFNTGGAVGVLYELLNRLNRFADERKLEDPSADANGESGVRGRCKGSEGIERDSRRVPRACAPAKGGDDQLVGGLMQLLIDLRAEARKSKNFAMADQIRKRLADLGVTLEDRPGGTGWRVG